MARMIENKIFHFTKCYLHNLTRSVATVSDKFSGVETSLQARLEKAEINHRFASV